MNIESHASRSPCAPINTSEGQTGPAPRDGLPNFGDPAGHSNRREVFQMECESRSGARATGQPAVESDCVVEMVNATTAAAIVGVSRRSWWRFVAEGRAPKPIRLGRCVRWRVLDIRDWIKGGCIT